MDIGIGALLFSAGLAGGVANAMAGGATLFTFPAMIVLGEFPGGYDEASAPQVPPIWRNLASS